LAAIVKKYNSPDKKGESSLFLVEIFDGSNRSVARRTELELNAMI